MTPNVQLKTRASMLMAVFVGCQLALCSDMNYNPEQYHDDGIPVISVRSIRPLSSSTSPSGFNNKWAVAKRVQRRQDADMDDTLDELDDDEDTDRSASSTNGATIENPSYGESRRAEREGKDIENFFDRHLGPGEQSASSGSDGNEANQAVDRGEAPSLDSEQSSDDFDAAASGPISSLLHGLIFSRVTSNASDSTLGSKKSKGPFVIRALMSGSSESTSDDDDKSKNTAAVLPASMVAAPSSVVAYEPQASAGVEDGQQADGGDGGAGLREIYIGRRPAVMSYLEQAQQQSSNGGMQQSSHLDPHYQHTVAGSANVWRTPHTGYQHQQVVVPVAASHAYHQQQHYASESPGAAADDEEREGEEQTVTYGLSFGSRPHAAEADEMNNERESQALQQQDQPQMTEQMLRAQQKHYQQQMTAAGYVPYNVRYRQTAGAYGYPAGNANGATGVGYQLTPAQQQHILAQHYSRQRQHPAQYVRQDSNNPDEALARAAANVDAAQSSYARLHDQDTGRYRAQPVREPAGATGNNQPLNRRSLLASLHKEILSNPAYLQQTDSTNRQKLHSARARPKASPVSSNDDASPGRQPLTAFNSVHKTFLGNDLDSYNSFHAEVDPYKAYTTSTRMVPGGDSAQHLDNGQPANDNRDETNAGQEPGSIQVAKTDQTDSKGQHEGPKLLTGPLANFDATSSNGGIGDLLRTTNEAASAKPQEQNNHIRVRRDDSDEREDADDDGVWVDDDDDDENRQQSSSDVNQKAQEPEDDEEDDAQQDTADNEQVTSRVNPPQTIGGPHGYELSPNDLMIYNG